MHGYDHLNMANLHNLKRNKYGQLIKSKTLSDNIKYLVENSNVQAFINIKYIEEILDDKSTDLANFSQQVADGVSLLKEVQKIVRVEQRTRDTAVQVSYFPNVYSEFL